MNDRDSKVLESYLNTLDRSLLKLSTSDRAEIITEIKGHVLDAMEREDGRTLDSVLSSLGEPEAVANKYLMERGLSPGRASKTPVVKWITIGILGTMGISAFFFIMAGVLFSPLIEVNEKAGTVRILDGLISISESKTEVGFSMSSHQVKSIVSMTPEMIFKLKFNNGKIDIENTESGTVSWDCQVEEPKEPVVTNIDGILTLDLTEANGIKCDIELPMISAFEIEGSNGKIDYENPRVDSSIVLSNGKIDFELDGGLQYEHDLQVGAGLVKGFPASVIGGTKLRVDLGNGMIQVD